MRQDIEKSWVHACQGEQQDLDLESDSREDQKAVELARDPENSRLRDRHCTRDRLRRKTSIC